MIWADTDVRTERQARSLPLLCEPDRPTDGQRAYHGWLRTRTIRDRITRIELRRDHADDEYGARVQWAIVRYALHGMSRRSLAAELCVTETTAQSYLTGAAWTAYGRPILRALKRLGISGGKSIEREREILTAQRAVLARAFEALSGATLTPRQRRLLQFELRLLTLEAVS